MKILIAIFLLYSGLEAATLSELITKVRLCTNDSTTDTSLQKRSDTEITDILNQAQREVTVYTWCIYKSTSFSITSDSSNPTSTNLYSANSEYNLPTDWIAMDRVVLGSGGVLEETSMPTLDKESIDWFSNPSSGTPTQYYTRGASSVYKIGIQPPEASTGTVEAYYFAYPTDMSAGTDTPFNGLAKTKAFHELLVWYSAAYFLRPYDQSMAKDYASMYVSMLQVMEKIYPYKPSYFPQMSGDRGYR